MSLRMGVNTWNQAEPNKTKEKRRNNEIKRANGGKDGECRGKGKIVKGNIALINVAGKAGETVTFRLHNEMTGEYSDIKESAAYSMMAGSLATPLSLTADGNGTTDINGVADINEDDIVAIYTLNGQKVSEMTEGVYIIQVRENGKIVTKKVKK